MAIGFRGSKAGSYSSTSTQSISLTDLLDASGATTAPAIGDFVVVTIAHSNASGSSRTLAQLTPTTSGYAAPTGISASVTAPTNETNVCSLAMFGKAMSAPSADTSVTLPACSASTTSISYVIEVFTGVDVSSPWAVTATTASAQNTGLANPPAVTTAASPAGQWIIGGFGAAVASASVFTNTGATPYDTTANYFKSAVQNTATNRSVAGMGIKTGVAVSTAFDAAITGSTTTNTGSWAAISTALKPAPTLATLTWGSGGSVAENSANTTAVGTVAGRTASSTLSLQDDAGGRFAIDSATGNITVANGSLLDYETNTSHNITVREILTGASNTPNDTVLTVTITDVAEGPTLAALTWGSGGSVPENSANGTLVGGLSGKTSGSTLSLFDDAGGRFSVSGLGAVSVANSSLLDYETNTSHNITVRETLAGATNTPRDTTLTVTVTDVTAPVFTSSSTVSVAENATLSHTLTFSSGSPALSIVGGADQAKFELFGSILRWASNGTKDYEAPDDADTNNVYVVTVRAGGGTETTDQTISVTVTNVTEGGTVGGATYNFNTFSGIDVASPADSVSDPLTAATYARFANVVIYEQMTGTYASTPVLRASITSGSTTPANAITNNSYIKFVLTGTGSLKRIRFNGAKGGASSNRGFSIRTSNDSYASEVYGVLDQASVRPNWTAYDISCDIPLTSGSLEVRFYLHTPGTSSTQEFDDVIFDVQSAAFAPSSLFLSGDVGYAWNPTDLTKVWQNSDGTGTGAFTSPIGRVNDVSGLNNHLTSTDVVRPVLQNVANGMMKFDGSNDILTAVPCLWAGGAGTVIMAVKGPSQDGKFLLGETNSAAGGAVWAPGLRTNTGGDMLFYWRGDNFTPVAVNQDVNLFDDTVKVYAIVDDGTQVKHYVNGTLLSTYNYTSRATLQNGEATTINQAHIGNAMVGGLPYDNSTSAYIGAGIVIDRALDSTELNNATTWVSNLHGLGGTVSRKPYSYVVNLI
jgi:hypothetical protein